MRPGKPMLAATATSKDLPHLEYPMLVSAKFDGVRALCRGGAVFSRSLKPLPNRNLQRLFASGCFDGLDGELIIGDPTARNCFSRTTSCVMSHEGDIAELRYFVFDWINHADPFAMYFKRLHDLYEVQSFVPPNVRDRVIVVDQKPIHKSYDLECIEADLIKEGYEGVIIRHPDAPYKHGRSTLREQGMMKLKRFIDVELTVVGYNEKFSNQNEATISETGNQVRSSHQDGMVPTGTLGSLICQWSTTQRVNVGSGFTEEQRFDLWEQRQHLIGQRVKIKYQEYGMKDVPRLPIFLGFRDEMDL